MMKILSTFKSFTLLMGDDQLYVRCRCKIMSKFSTSVLKSPSYSYLFISIYFDKFWSPFTEIINFSPAQNSLPSYLCFMIEGIFFLPLDLSKMCCVWFFLCFIPTLDHNLSLVFLCSLCSIIFYDLIDVGFANYTLSLSLCHVASLSLSALSFWTSAL